MRRVRRRLLTALAATAVVAAAVLLLLAALGSSDDGRAGALERDIAEARCPGEARPDVSCEPLDRGGYACVKRTPGSDDERLTVDDSGHFEFSLIC